MNPYLSARLRGHSLGCMTVLYTVSRDQALTVRNPGSDSGNGSWLSCQSTNNLLSTFERYDKCRGIQIGVPTGDSNIVLALPRLNVK